jgi:hypothetical protein
MTYLIIKLFTSAAIILAVSEIAKRNTSLGALLLSLPLVSVLALCWLYYETKNVEKVSALASSTLWMVLPSLAFFILLPMLLKLRWNFFLSLTVASLGTAATYGLTICLLNRFGVKL